jgi:hypothetical protein
VLEDHKVEGVAGLEDEFAQFITYFQWFRPPIHPAFMQRPVTDFEL